MLSPKFGSTAYTNDFNADLPVFSTVITLLILGRWDDRSTVLSTLLLIKSADILDCFAVQHVAMRADTTNSSNSNLFMLYLWRCYWIFNGPLLVTGSEFSSGKPLYSLVFRLLSWQIVFIWITKLLIHVLLLRHGITK